MQVVAGFVTNPEKVPSRYAALFVDPAVGQARRRHLLAVVLLLACMVTWAGHRTPAKAACLPPAVTVTPKAAPAGSTVVVSGHGWSAGCADTVGCPTDGPCAADPGSPPRSGIQLRFSQGRHGDWLGTTDADTGNRFSFSAVVPGWAKPGAATVSADNVASGFRVAARSAGSAHELGATSPVPALAGAGPDLPKTGSATNLAAGISALLLVAALLLRLT